MKHITKENMSLIMREEDGYVNATALCKQAGKLFADYCRLESTKSFISELSGSMGIPISDLIIANNKVRNEEKGSYVHPKVAIHLAQWLSPKFAVFVSNIMFNYFNGEPDPKVKSIDPRKAQKRLKEINRKIEKNIEESEVLAQEAQIILKILNDHYSDALRAGLIEDFQ